LLEKVKEKMRTKYIILFLPFILSFSCSPNSKEFFSRNHRLQSENDSLLNIIYEVSNKYVFDSISFRDICSPKDSYNKNSKSNVDFLVVPYSSHKSYFTQYDNIERAT